MKPALIFLIFILAVSLLFSYYSCKSDRKPFALSESHRDSTEVDTTNYTAMGQKFVSATQAVLSKNLMEAISKDGPEHALEFCNIKAYPLTDSMSHALNAKIKRVTDKTRNPDNHANTDELAHIALLKTQLLNGETLTPKVIEQHEKMVGYYPILTNTLCLQCHGKPNTDVSVATLEKINTLYPKDQALGYSMNELRGLWVVEMERR